MVLARGLCHSTSAQPLCPFSFPLVYFLSVRILCRKITLEQRPLPHVSGFVWKRRFFFSGLASFSHVFGENGHQKRRFQKQSLERRFLKTLATHLRLDGRKRRNTTSFTSFTTSITRVLWGMLSYFHCLPFSYGRSKTIRIRYVWRLFFYFFETGEKSPFSKTSRYEWRGPKTSEPTKCVYANFFREAYS